MYDKDVLKDYTLTSAIQYDTELEALMEKLIYLSLTDEFIPFYSSFLDMLSDVESIYHIDLDYAKEMYYKSFDVKEGLSFIKSDRTNTLEMLFEAEEVALLANETERENEQILLLSDNIADRDSSNDDILKEHLDDPELMIKMLKAQKGL